MMRWIAWVALVGGLWGLGSLVVLVLWHGLVTRDREDEDRGPTLSGVS